MIQVKELSHVQYFQLLNNNIMQNQQHLKSAFTVVKVEKQIEDYFDQVQRLAKYVVESGNKIKVVEHLGLLQLPVYIKLIFNLIISLLSDCTSDQYHKQLIKNFIKNPLSLKIKLSIYTTITSIIENKCFISQNQKYYQEISYSMFFKSNLLSLAIAILFESYSVIRLDRFTQFYNSLISNKGNKQLSSYMFSLYGGNGLNISKDTFVKSLTQVIVRVGTFFTAEESIITRNIGFAKSIKCGKKILDESVVILSNFKNHQYINVQISLLANQIFNNQQFLARNIFIENINISRTVKSDEKSLPLNQYLRVYFQLLSLQFMMISSQQFKSSVIRRDHIQVNNYYLEAMQKILKKCPYNGHQSCDCKKCNCVRRNRESAKLSQQKKRNAVEQLGQMQSRINQLEKRNKYLEDYNAFLMSLFESFKDHPGFKQLISKTAQPINKILDNDIE